MATIENPRRVLYLTSMDLRRLRDVIATASVLGNGSTPKGVGDLKALLENATIAPEVYLPANVVTLGSKIRIKDEESGQSREVIVSLPGDCLESKVSLSILDPIGSAALGHAAGETFTYGGAANAKRATVEEVIYQPIDCAWC